jgi:hypothetical protein
MHGETVKFETVKSDNNSFSIKVKSALEQDTKAQRGSRGIGYSFFNLDARWGGWSMPRPGRFNRGNTRYTLYRRLGGAPGTVWTATENFTLAGIRSPDRPARDESFFP